MKLAIGSALLFAAAIALLGGVALACAIAEKILWSLV